MSTFIAREDFSSLGFREWDVKLGLKGLGFVCLLVFSIGAKDLMQGPQDKHAFLIDPYKNLQKSEFLFHSF